MSKRKSEALPQRNRTVWWFRGRKIEGWVDRRLAEAVKRKKEKPS